MRRPLLLLVVATSVSRVRAEFNFETGLRIYGELMWHNIERTHKFILMIFKNLTTVNQ